MYVSVKEPASLGWSGTLFMWMKLWASPMKSSHKETTLRYNTRVYDTIRLSEEAQWEHPKWTRVRAYDSGGAKSARGAPTLSKLPQFRKEGRPVTKTKIDPRPNPLPSPFFFIFWIHSFIVCCLQRTFGLFLCILLLETNYSNKATSSPSPSSWVSPETQSNALHPRIWIRPIHTFPRPRKCMRICARLPNPYVSWRRMKKESSVYA